MSTTPPIPDEQAALLTAIITEPDEDTPRLVYADWLEENGDAEQAAFIRDSIALDTLAPGEDAHRQHVSERLDRIAEANAPQWLAALGLRWADPAYDRGFPDSVLYRSYQDFLEDRLALFAVMPIRELIITDLGGGDPSIDALSELAVISELSRLRSLRLANNNWPVSPDGWGQFARSPHLSELELLAVESAGLGDEHAEVLAECQNLRELRQLGLSGNQITALGALVLVRSPNLASLDRLGLSDNLIVEDATRGGPFRALVDALVDRFDSNSALYMGV